MVLKLLSPLHKASRQIEVYLSREISRIGVSGTEGHLLSYLLSYGPCPVGELIRVFGHKPSTLTSILDRLESAELIDRALDPTDRRSFQVALTPQGRKAGRELVRLLDRFEADVLSRASASDLAGFRAIMASVHDVTGVTLRQTGDSHERQTARDPIPVQPPDPPSKSRRPRPRSKPQGTR